MSNKIINETTEERGQTMAEYAVVLGVITIAIVTTFAVLSGAIEGAFERTLEIVGPVF
jgi:Flp pilus assembly pilin Flp